MKTLKSRIDGEYIAINEIASAVTEKTGFNRRDVEEICYAFVDVCANAVNNGIAVTLPGLLKIKLRHRKARMVRNPRTEEFMQCPEMIIAKASIFPSFATKLRENKELLEKYKKEHNID